jgi:hypothetical protein
VTAMGPVYPTTLRRLGFGAAVDAVQSANPTPRNPEIPAAAQALVDELIVSGDAETGRAGIDKWLDAGAELPVLVLPPGRPVAELEYALEALSPADGGRRSPPRDRVNGHRTHRTRLREGVGTFGGDP